MANGDGDSPKMKIVTAERAEGGLLIERLEPRTVRPWWSAFDQGVMKQGDYAQARLDTIAANTLKPLPAAE